MLLLSADNLLSVSMRSVFSRAFANLSGDLLSSKDGELITNPLFEGPFDDLHELHEGLADTEAKF